MLGLERYPSLTKIVSAVVAVWPEHSTYCERRFQDDDEGFLVRTEEFASLALERISDLNLYCESYRWMCEEFLKEEWYFARHGQYRLSTFEEAYREVYGDDGYMSRYVRAILISQVLWSPHARAFDFFRTSFLPGLGQGASYLEIGPGHGFFLYFASKTPKIARLEAWDVSDASISETRQALAKLGVTADVILARQDILKAVPTTARFDGAVISEVLEHLERPDLALQTLRSLLKPGGIIFINAPVNSPAPDHIYLWSSTEEFAAFVEAQGFEIMEERLFPLTGVSLKRAKKLALSISCVLIARAV